MTGSATDQTDLTRRDLLKRGALIGGAVVWATPVVQVVGMSRAHARPPSPSCVRYCLKWEADTNERVIDPETIETVEYVTPCEDAPWAVLWTSTWVALGGGDGSDADALGTLDTDGTSEQFTDDTGVDEDDDANVDDPPVAEEDDVAESGTEPLLSDTDVQSAADEDEDTFPGRGRDPAGGGNTEDQAATQSHNPGHGDGHPGNCLICDEQSVNDNDAAATLGATIVVYGDRNIGFYVSYPDTCKLAPIDDEDRLAAAAKCGGPGGGECTTEQLTEETDECISGNKRVFIPTCGSQYEISHLELILDCCD
jgi:hypothetical protein